MDESNWNLNIGVRLAATMKGGEGGGWGPGDWTFRQASKGAAQKPKNWLAFVINCHLSTISLMLMY